MDVDLVELAGWCHDLGHPPFGHQGEEALDEKMLRFGGFEGNAQTLRLISRIEKRQHSAKKDPSGFEGQIDHRLGLNLTARTMASVLKYDNEIPVRRRKNAKVTKGYYYTDRDTVRWIKSKVAPRYDGKLKTIECQIMDVADDIAYSTYDLEDTFKAGFLGPLDLLSANELYGAVALKVTSATETKFSAEDVGATLVEIFSELTESGDAASNYGSLGIATAVYQAASRLAKDAYLRSAFTSRLIRLALDGIQLSVDQRRPALSKVSLRYDSWIRVEVLKHFTYLATIQSNRVIVPQFRAKEIVHTIFDALSTDRRLLPDDARQLYERVEANQKPRVICDYIAGMTDRYAAEFFGRLRSENPQTIFKPL